MSVARILQAPGGITRAYLQGWLGQTVDQFCSNATAEFAQIGDKHNHCAHFVSHALAFQIGKLCNTMNYTNRKKPETGRSLVVSDLFNACPQRGPWGEKPATIDLCLIFAVGANGASQAKTGEWIMANIPLKHVGIHLGGECYNYHNTQSKKHNEGVYADKTTFFENVYGKGTKTFYGTLPA